MDDVFFCTVPGCSGHTLRDCSCPKSLSVDEGRLFQLKLDELKKEFEEHFKGLESSPLIVMSPGPTIQMSRCPCCGYPDCGHDHSEQVTKGLEAKSVTVLAKVPEELSYLPGVKECVQSSSRYDQLKKEKELKAGKQLTYKEMLAAVTEKPEPGRPEGGMYPIVMPTSFVGMPANPDCAENPFYKGK